MLPSFNNERGWNAVTTRGLLIGLVVGTATGAALPLLRHVQVSRERTRRGFEVSPAVEADRK
jgi:hypothetical protein